MKLFGKPKKVVAGRKSLMVSAKLHASIKKSAAQENLTIQEFTGEIFELYLIFKQKGLEAATQED